MFYLENKPDFDKAMERVNAWYDFELLDRPPVRFFAHNAQFEAIPDKGEWTDFKDRWFDTEYQIETFERYIDGMEFLAETFPSFAVNLGPNVYPSMIGAEVVYGETTSWAVHGMEDCSETDRINFSVDNEHFKKIESITKLALERSKNRYIVQYTDIHHGVDCADAFIGTDRLMTDMYDDPDGLMRLIGRCSQDFPFIYKYFNDMIKAAGHPSNTWMNIPSSETFHVPSCDVAAMLGPEHFRRFCLPILREEVKVAKHNVFHLDGKGMIPHVDDILDVPEINGIQWVQGVCGDKPIMQWVPLIKKIQDRKRGVVVGLDISELDAFMDAVRPRGIFLTMQANDFGEQRRIMERLTKWR